ncbi:hypothetical protein QAD02_013171 [Eretmocerus hayati]|uniref:Uncharacterized protein n=1 Tax=Eretmocerus hayati TaxID=131215 RepID=A0ACC2P258_9HYME|nr:hypothetical protein QAD02_013171 [Eretmocerus hayati]
MATHKMCFKCLISQKKCNDILYESENCYVPKWQQINPRGSEKNNSQQQEGKNNEDEQRTNLVICYISQTMTEGDLHGMSVTTWVQLNHAKLVTAEGNGIVNNYRRPEDANNAIITLHKLRIRNEEADTVLWL